jgi:hypothetical protein
MTQKTEPRHLRSFAMIVGSGFGIIGCWPLLFRGEALRLWALITASVLVALGLVIPKALQPAYKLWMALGHALGWINSRIILGVLFFTLFTLVAIVLRLLKVDPMRRRFEPETDTYRIPRTLRPSSHLKHQF